MANTIYQGFLLPSESQSLNIYQNITSYDSTDATVTATAFVTATNFCSLNPRNYLSLHIRNRLQRRQWHPTPVLLPGKSEDGGAWKAAVHGVFEGWTQLSNFTFTFHFHALEKEMATHSSVLAWRIPGTGDPGGLPSMGSCRVGHD